MPLPSEHFLPISEHLEPRHEYEARLKLLWSMGLIATGDEIWIEHEDDCALHDGGLCRCNCEIRVEKKKAS